MRIVILGSGEGTNAVAIMKAAVDQQLGDTEIVGVFSDIKEAMILEHAKSFFFPPITWTLEIKKLSLA